MKLSGKHRVSILSLPQPRSLPHCLHPRGVHLQWTYMGTSSPKGPQFTLGFACGVLHCMDFDKCIMTYIIQNNFTALKVIFSACSSLLSYFLDANFSSFVEIFSFLNQFYVYHHYCYCVTST